MNIIILIGIILLIIGFLFLFGFPLILSIINIFRKNKKSDDNENKILMLNIKISSILIILSVFIILSGVGITIIKEQRNEKQQFNFYINKISELIEHNSQIKLYKIFLHIENSSLKEKIQSNNNIILINSDSYILVTNQEINDLKIHISNEIIIYPNVIIKINKNKVKEELSKCSSDQLKKIIQLYSVKNE